MHAPCNIYVINIAQLQFNNTSDMPSVESSVVKQVQRLITHADTLIAATHVNIAFH